MGHSIYFSFFIKAGKKSVFEAISQPSQLEKWWPLKCSGIPEVGSTYNFNFTDEYDWYAEVKSCKTSDHIHYKMIKSDGDWNPTTFGFDLEEDLSGVPALQPELKDKAAYYSTLVNTGIMAIGSFGLKKFV